MRPYKTSGLFHILTSLFLLASVTAFPQGEEKVKDLFVEAESYFLFEEYKDALPLYQRILRTDPENFNINYKIGICYLNNIYQVDKSISYLETAAKGTNPSSKTTSFKERMAPPEALYYLGNAYRANNQLRNAIEAYEQFKLVLDPVVYDASLVDEQITACKVAAAQQQKPMYFISVNVGEGINDRFEELNPLISGDEKTLVFTRKLQFYDAVFFSRRENGKWTDPINLTPSFALDGNSYSTGLSYNGDELLVYRSDNFDGNLYVSKYKSGKWSKLEKLGGNINTKYWESHASLSKDGGTLYFTSNREGGYGGLDIYRAVRNRGGDWGTAFNLGPIINSKYNEDTPFITDDGNTLYFSSMGHYNMGGYDIFYSTRLDNGQWSKPVNVGYPLNTTNDDLFFVPLRDGAYAYYARYNPDDSYGMTDIYKLEVFTELHPRKFILNGITKVDGKVNPDFTQYTATLINSKNGKVIDQSPLNRDGSYTLNALSGEFDLNIKGSGINDKTERVFIPVNNPANIIVHSTILTASAAPTSSSAAEPVAFHEPAVGPELIIQVKSYQVSTGETLPIRLDVEKGTTLAVVTLVDDSPLKTESFEMKRRRFVYMLTPQPGVNTLRFTLFNNKGDSTFQEVTVVYIPTPSEDAAIPPTQQVVLSDNDRYMGVVALAGGNLAKFLQANDIRQMSFSSIADLYDYLFKNAAEQGYSVEDIDNLMAAFLSAKDLNLFHEELLDHSSDSLAKAVKQINFTANNVFTSGALLDYLFASDDAGYNYEELRDALYRIAALNHNQLELIKLLESYAAGELATLLGRMKQDWQSYNDTKAIADYLLKAAQNNEFPVAQLESMLKLAAADLNMYFLSQGLLFISSENLKQCLLNLNLETLEIRNASELISYLLDTADKQGYSKRELLENIEKIRRDPYYYVDMFRKMLAEKASGSLKEFLQEIDIRDLNISTFEGLIDYLLSQSQFRDYNREMVYQLLLDIINPKDVEEFLLLVRKYADDRIISALDATDANQFSTPLEVMQYLLSVADEYNYTERDLLRVLLKMLLRKGPSPDDPDEKQGWFAGINKPALVTSLIVVNAIIIILLILFILRKKRKNE